MRGIGLFVPALLASWLTPRAAEGALVFSCQQDAHCLACHGIVRTCLSKGAVDVDQCIVDEERRAGLRSCLMHPYSAMSTHEVAAMLETEQEDFSDHGKFRSMLQEVVETLREKQLRELKELSGETVTDESDIPEIMKKQIIKLCMYANYHDKYENAKRHIQGTLADIEQNIVHVINNFIHEPNFKERIENFLGNPAVCLKHPSDWVSDRALYEDPKVPSVGAMTAEDTELFGSNARGSAIRSAGDANCNMESCNRFADEKECESNIRMLNQGTCSNCWAFAAATAFQAYRCRLGHGFAEPSIKYITLCKSEYFQQNRSVEACAEGGSILQFLNSMDKSKMLPTSNDLPYDEEFTSHKCPLIDASKPNLWKGVTLKDKEANGYLYTGYMRFDFADYAQRNSIEELIKIVKEAVIEQGAVFISMHVQTNLPYDHNGEVVKMSCEQYNADHAMTLIGYGSYTKPSGEKGQYWMIRNSWGIKWGDKGYFKLDMYGPAGCRGKVLQSAFLFNINIPKQTISAALPKDKASEDLDTKHVINNITVPEHNTTPEVKPVRPFRGPDKREVVQPEYPDIVDPYYPGSTDPLEPVMPVRPYFPNSADTVLPDIIEPYLPETTEPVEPVRPYYPGRVEPFRPHFPTRVEPLKPYYPGRVEPVKPYYPSRVEPLKPYYPGRVEPVKPYYPGRVEPLKPYYPSRGEPVKPYYPSRVEPVKPYYPGRVEPVKPYYPGRVEPVRPHFPTRVEPMKPYYPRRVEPLKPYNPRRVKPLKPYYPGRVEPLKPYYPIRVEPGRQNFPGDSKPSKRTVPFYRSLGKSNCPPAPPYICP